MLGRRIVDIFNRDTSIKVFTCGRGSSYEINFDLLDDIASAQFNNVPNEIDVAIYCSASFLGNSINDAVHNEMINSVGSLRAAQIADKLNTKHFINVSSISSLANQSMNSYGLSKKHGHENLLYIFKEIGMKYTSLFFSQLYDEYGKARKHQRMLYSFIDSAFIGQDIWIYGNNDPYRNYLFIDDAVNIIRGVILHDLVGSYPCVHPSSNTCSEVAKMIQAVINKGGQVGFLRDKSDIPDIEIPTDISIYDKINYLPSIDLIQGITRIKNCLNKRED